MRWHLSHSRDEAGAAPTAGKSKKCFGCTCVRGAPRGTWLRSGCTRTCLPYEYLGRLSGRLFGEVLGPFQRLGLKSDAVQTRVQTVGVCWTSYPPHLLFAPAAAGAGAARLLSCCCAAVQHNVHTIRTPDPHDTVATSVVSSTTVSRSRPRAGPLESLLSGQSARAVRASSRYRRIAPRARCCCGVLEDCFPLPCGACRV